MASISPVSVWSDVRYAWRLLWRSRGFSAAAVLILALCIGLNTAIFSLVNALLLRPLAVMAPEELAFVYSTDRGRPMVGSREQVLELATETDIFAGVASARTGEAKLRLGLDVESLIEEAVSSNYFDVLGVRPALGRALIQAVDDESGANPVVVISDGLWRRRFDADPNIIGRTVSLPRELGTAEAIRPYTIVGVMGPQFGGVSSRLAPTDIWVPLVRRAEETGLGAKNYPVEAAITRMRTGVTHEQVQALVAVWGRRIDTRELPGLMGGERNRAVLDARRVFLPFDSARTITPSRLGVGLMACVALVLVIGVANLAGIVMARGIARQSEWGIRLVLGASRWRVARILLAEGMIVAVIGGIAGLLSSRSLAVMLLDTMPPGVSGATGFGRQIALGVPLDWRVLTFSILLVTGAGIVVGLAPLLQAWRTDLVSMLSGSFVAPRPLRAGVRHWILIPQIAVSLALLLTAGVAVRAFVKVALVPPGYEPDRAAVVRVDLPEPLGVRNTPGDGARLRASYDVLFRRILDLSEQSPEIEAVAMTSTLPLNSSTATVIAEDSLLAKGSPRWVPSAKITPGYFHVLGIPVLHGRGFDHLDLTGKARVVVVDETFAAEQWPGRRAIGQRLAFHAPESTTPPVWHEVIGVVGAVRGPLSEGAPRPFVYAPMTDPMFFREMIVARGRGSSTRLLEELRRIVAEADPRAGIVQARTLEAAIDDIRYPRSIAAGLLGFSGLMGLLLASTGLYGVVSYSVGQRRKELSIRTALGAGSRDITRLVLKEGARVAGVGIVIGFALGFGAIAMTSKHVLAIPSLDVTTLVIAPLLLGAVTLLACYVPARRAMRFEPMDVLRGL